MDQIKFWIDEANKTLYVYNLETNAVRKVRNSKEIKQFVSAYGLSVDDMRGVEYGEDKLNYFGKLGRGSLLRRWLNKLKA
ncbi:hypothetical protein [Thermoflavimicrobium daqui]|uniref:Uncharacterized protein n=1 Tax=Thermoflavimicrobium daqui TaxID=2137476 RepID=A0A364K9F1_9BACL|nr:hypothetical protein [Thermoflavimicrobium daqui]RAL26926.1 hypothetical protein DL897_02435 [Thermoflavimicrobium daqui]